MILNALARAVLLLHMVIQIDTRNVMRFWMTEKINQCERQAVNIYLILHPTEVHKNQFSDE